MPCAPVPGSRQVRNIRPRSRWLGGLGKHCGRGGKHQKHKGQTKETASHLKTPLLTAAPHSMDPWVSTGALPPTSLMMVTILLPSLSGAPVTVILSPAFNVLAFQPKPNSLCGEAVSATHFSMLPFSPITSK